MIRVGLKCVRVEYNIARDGIPPNKLCYSLLEIACLIAVGIWGGSDDDAGAGDGTEVTPSGLRPPCGPSPSPLPQLPLSGTL